MNLRDRLVSVVRKTLDEGLDSSKDMIANNSVGGFDDMGMAKANPGEFAPEEITNAENLVNKADIANDTDFEGKVQNVNCGLPGAEIAIDVVDISANPEEDIVKKDREEENPLAKLFGESRFSKIVEAALNHKSCREVLSEETDFAGPRDWNPDTRINVSDVIRTLKDEIGEGSEGIHVDQIYDDQKNNAYKVSQIDKDLLPKKIQVMTSILELDGDTYRVNKISDSYPMPK